MSIFERLGSFEKKGLAISGCDSENYHLPMKTFYAFSKMAILALWIIVKCTISIFSQSVYKASSVLAEGEWYKLSIPNSGVYEIDASFLQALGINVSVLDPATVKIYGNGGGMLPQENSVFRYDDLVENAILVFGEEDGSFDQGDRIVFYAQGPHIWRSQDGKYRHETHLYSDTSYYFLSFGGQSGKRIKNLSNQGPTTYNPLFSEGLLFHEKDLENPLHSGRFWLGEKLTGNTPAEFTFTAKDPKDNGSLEIVYRFSARNSISSKVVGRINQTSMESVPILRTNIDNLESRYYQSSQGTWSLTNEIWNQNEFTLELSYDSDNDSRANAWVDWIEVHYDQAWKISSNKQVSFRLNDKVLQNGIAQISISGGENEPYIWDISDPLNPNQLNYTTNDSAISFSLPTESSKPKHLIAWESALFKPASGKKLPNQDLHAAEPVDYLVITHPSLESEARRLAEFHATHYGQSIYLSSPDKIYNEFSSGMRDVSAIRDFVKMMYNKSGGKQPEAVLLFGDGTFDYKRKLTRDYDNSETHNLIPTYQSRNSWDPVESYTSDDFFSFMDEEEGFWGEGSRIAGDNRVQINLIDVPIGRIPVENLEEAKQIVDKIIAYTTDTEEAGPWRSRVVLVGDYKEGEGQTHIKQADDYSAIISENSPCTNLEKIFIDNFNMVSTPTNPLFPGARETLLNAFKKGSLILNYTGHGGEFAWSNSRIFINGDIPELRNSSKLPAVVTATCEYGRFDDPNLPKSGGELLLLEPSGGSIAMFTTVRLVFSFPNATLNKNFYREVFRYNSGKKRMPTLGEVMKHTKNRTFPVNSFTNINSRNFTLLGDPGLILNYPAHKAKLNLINNMIPDSSRVDTLKSLSTVELSGSIYDQDGNSLSGFQGSLSATVFDKPSLFTTQLSNYSFLWQNNQIFNGKSSIKDGKFNIKFFVPLDISKDSGKAKISLYFNDSISDGLGCYNNIFLGGTAETNMLDTSGPEMVAYLCDRNWVNGSITGPNPELIVDLIDSSGINTTQGAVGHELLAILDNDESSPIILNSFYEAKQDSYTQGIVLYPFRNLSPGKHQLTIRAWDNVNNSSELKLQFVVADDNKIVIQQILSIPNPSTAGEKVEFRIQSNQKSSLTKARIEIYTLTGSRIAEINSEPESGRLSWPGTNYKGNPVTPGIYIFKAIVEQLESDMSNESFGRLIIYK